MLHTDNSAIEYAKAIIKEKGISAIITNWFWLKNEEDNEGEDIFCYSLKRNDSSESLPGWDAPLFKRNGDLSDFVFPVYA